ncbi:helix-turn-helix domain-containing protein [Salinispora arenicola]|uniref:helix-turn-helix domain-containing protein n=1 Tax=Salinispora arenicola TaxID=168697 RepID=UPI0005BB193F|nr:XRE family transcriptional regulator [Salinispora arenicola]
MAIDVESRLQSVAPRLRALRRDSGARLIDVSAATGIPVSTLSRLESGQRRPNLRQLLALAITYRVTTDEIIGTPPSAEPHVNPRPVTRDGKTLIPLTRRAGGIQAYKMIVPGLERPVAPHANSHEGYEWLYVLNGRLRLVLAEQDLILTPGEAAEFDTRLPHWIGAADTAPVEVLALLGLQGERARVRARSRRVAGHPARLD